MSQVVGEYKQTSCTWCVCTVRCNDIDIRNIYISIVVNMLLSVVEFALSFLQILCHLQILEYLVPQNLWRVQ